MTHQFRHYLSPVLCVLLLVSFVQVSEQKAIYCLQAADVPHVAEFEGHTQTVKFAVFSQDGRKIFTSSYEKTARAWDIDSGQELNRWQLGESALLHVDFSLDGKKIASYSPYVTRIWDTESGKELCTLKKGYAEVRSLAFSPDGKKVATGHEDNIARIWDVELGKELQKLIGHKDYVLSVAFSPDGKKVISGGLHGDSTARIWDVESGKELQRLEFGNRNGVFSAKFSPDGKKVVTGSEDATVRIWDVDTGNELKKLGNILELKHLVVEGNMQFHQQIQYLTKKLEGHWLRVTSVAFSPDGHKIVSGSTDKTALIWDTKSGKVLQKLQGHTTNVNTAAFSPDGKRIVTASSDHTVRIWDAESGKELQRWGEPRTWAEMYSHHLPAHPAMFRQNFSQYQQLYAKAKTDSKDFSDDEVRMLLHDALFRHPPDKYHYAQNKLYDLGSSIVPLLLKEASKPLETGEDWYITEKVIYFLYLFNLSKTERSEARKITLAVWEKAPYYETYAQLMSDIGEPEDVPKLLSFIKEDVFAAVRKVLAMYESEQVLQEMIQNDPASSRVFRDVDREVHTFIHIIRAVGNIADVSQIPEIEKAIANWAKDMPPDGWWQKRFQDEVALCLANIRREPDDVPKLLSLLNRDNGTILLKPMLHLIGNIATVSQIPEIEKVLTEKFQNNHAGLGNVYFFEVELCLAKIRRDPKDVPKLLSFIENGIGGHELFLHWLQVLGNIATVSQIPEIEQVIATLAERELPGVPYEKWPKAMRDKIEASLANIHERSVR